MDAPEPDPPRDGQAENASSSTLAGRALRALRTPRIDAPPAEPLPAEPAPAAVDLVKPDVLEPTPDPVPAEDSSPADELAAIDEPAPVADRNRPVLVIAAVLAVLSLAYAAVGLAVYLSGTTGASAKEATARDDVVTAARIDIATLNTLDYRNPQAGLARWRAVTTGGFEQQIAESGSTVATAITKAKLITTGRVIAAAVTELDADKGTATVIASMDITKTPSSGSSATVRNRFRATMERVDGVWKVADLSQVQVQLS